MVDDIVVGEFVRFTRHQVRDHPPGSLSVAYLMGDLEAGIAALERALELEPDNALFRANLERLKAQSSVRAPPGRRAGE